MNYTNMALQIMWPYKSYDFIKFNATEQNKKKMVGIDQIQTRFYA